MRKNSVKYLERLVKEEMNKYKVALKDFRFRERGIEKIVNDVIPKDADTLVKIGNRAKWLMNNVPEDYRYGEMIEINNAIASNLHEHLQRTAEQYIGEL
jgi:hypothetical protein|tara:strand:+ start:117 stop:413 length:297 start_codon:yes stop_codon:yes gene_type:complete